MIGNEVVRLRDLRNLALRVRALAHALDGPTAESAEFGKSAVICWALARIATGHLRAHPYLSYQKGPGRLRDLANRSMAALAAFNARRQGRCASLCAEELRGVARALADARALTWSADLGEALGRTHIQLRRVGVELDARAQHEPGAIGKPETSAIAVQHSGESDWPYLAI
ncbi:MAG: hypothetical protein M3O26_19555 [Pseudomonadota bacterium]|nr:hypothetical protein [Pseudomonadota bacterium]